jgi:antitoxin component of RelBE/YafQ-DinJ toxin-antitoxin module
MSEENSSPEVSEESSPESPSESQEIPQEAQPAGQEALQEVVEDAIASGASEKEVKNLIKEFQLKVNGKMVNKRIDLSDENAVRNELQLSAAARNAMQESANLKKLYESEVNRLRQDPFSVLAEMGLDPDQLAEMRIQQRIEEMKKSPEQLEREKIQAELQAAREEANKLKAERESEQFEKLKEQAAAQIETEIEQALDSHKTLPKSRHIVKRIADSMLWAMGNGFDEVTAEDVMPLVEKEWREEMGRLMDDSPEDVLEQLIGQRNIERLRAKRLNAMSTSNAKTANSIKPTAGSVQKQEEQKREKIKQRDFFKSLGKKK